MMTKTSRSVGDFVRLFQYNRWATNRLLDVLADQEDPPERAVELLSHLLRAQDLWYGRVRDTARAELSLWARDDLADCVERAEESSRRWRAFVDDCTAEELDARVSYTNSSGTTFETPLREILSHVVNHGTHHRAQISLVLREANIAPPPTDYIFFVREE